MKTNSGKPIKIPTFVFTLLISMNLSAQEPDITNGDCLPAAISAQPINLLNVQRGSVQTFSVDAAGTFPLSFQWYKSGYPATAVGTNSPALTIRNIGPADAGYYYVIVKNACGADTSAVVSLSIEPTPKSSTVCCPALAVPPAVIAVGYHPCEGIITGVLQSVTDTPDPLISKGTRVYRYSYTSRGGGVAYWEYTYTIDYSGGLIAPANTASTVSSPEEASDPGAPSDITDACGRKVSAVFAGSSLSGNTVIWTYRYTACDCKTTADWIHTYTISSISPKTAANTSLISKKSDCILTIPNGFSPNGDGINDYFIIPCMEKHPDARLLIFSANSALLYTQEHYGNSDFWGDEDASWWKGTDRNKNKLVSGTYIYVLELKPGKNDPVKTGYVFISR